jgi:deoxyribose-phosphate aldolase
MKLASYIDHTILKPDCTRADIQNLCEEAIKHQFAAVCIPPFFVQDAYQLLEEYAVKTSTVIGFPMGYSTTSAKVEEIKRAIDEGADEVDVVINICALKSGNWNYVQNDIDSMITAAHLKGKLIKVILETGLMQEEEIHRLCGICREVGPDFVKTSTGFNGAGATVPVVESLRHELEGTPIKVKASGGIRTPEDARAMIDAGAQRLGSSSGVRIVTE